MTSQLPGARHDLIDGILEGVELVTDGIRVHLSRGGLQQRLIGATADQSGDPIMIAVAANLTRHGMANRLVVNGGAPNRDAGPSDDALVRAIACGRAWFDELASGRASSFGEIAARVGVTDRYVSRIADLAFLAPDVVEAILAGEQRGDVTVKSLTVESGVPLSWAEQRRTILRAYGAPPVF